MAEAQTITTFVLDAALPWLGPSDGPQGTGDYERGTLIGPAGRYGCAIRKIAPGGATVAVAGPSAPPGSALALELASGQRHRARVDWARGDELGLTFAEPLDIVALINRNLVAQPAERRSMPRIELRQPLHVKWCEHLEPATMRNVSSTGVQVEGARLPPVGTLASLFVDGLNLPPAEVVWRQGNLAGFELFEELRWSSLIAWVREVGRRR